MTCLYSFRCGPGSLSVCRARSVDECVQYKHHTARGREVTHLRRWAAAGLVVDLLHHPFEDLEVHALIVFGRGP